MPRMLCPECKQPARVVRSDRESRALIFCEDEACGWEAFVNALPVGIEPETDEARVDEAVALRRPSPRRRGMF